MFKWTKSAAVTMAITFAVSSAGVAATATKTPAKPAAKAPAKTPAKAPAKAPAKPAATPQTPHYVQGTTQLKGEYAEFGKAYTLGKENPMNVTLKSAEYTCDTVVIGDHFYYPAANEKLLLIRYQLHNPQPRECPVHWEFFKITAVDNTNTNRDYIHDVGTESSKITLNLELKPAQKMDVYTVINVPAKGEVPKLMFKSTDDLVLRYDLKGKVKGLEAPFADPKDATRATALSKVPAKMNTYYPLGEFALRLDKLEYSKAKMGDYELEEGCRFLVLNCSVKNVTTESKPLHWETFNVELYDADGNEIEWVHDMFQNTRATSVNVDLKPDQEYKCRYFFSVPEDQQPESFSVTMQESRTYVFDVTSAK